MNEDVEAAVGCSGMVLIFGGMVWAVSTTPAITEFARTIPPWAFTLFIGMFMVLIALTNKRNTR